MKDFKRNLISLLSSLGIENKNVANFILNADEDMYVTLGKSISDTITAQENRIKELENHVDEVNQ